MQLNALDWGIIAVYFALALAAGLVFARRSGQNIEEYFVSGRHLPWWIVGTSMVATTFSTDTPNLVTDIVRRNGVGGNWIWWAFLITGMFTVFIYARLWRRSGVLTDVGFYELRYSGREAAFLRGFRALYLGVFFNAIVMASVTLAAFKIAGILLGFDKVATVMLCGTITVVYSCMAGLWGVVVTDLLLFVIAMAGSVAAAWYAVNHPEVGGLGNLLAHEAVRDKISLLPDFTRWETAVPVFVVPLAVQWWSSWYPGSEPGGGGFIAQRMLAARDEKHAVYATLWFTVAHYAIRPWPWILVALASLVVYPTLGDIQQRFPHLDESILRDDAGYSAMLVFLPHGLLGLVLASLAAAYMSTISTSLNWGASYVIDDFYKRFVNPNADGKHYVFAARLVTAGLMVLSGLLAMGLENAEQTFRLMLQIGAGTGLLFLLRWFWWRVNAWSEISAMVISFAVAVHFELLHHRVFGLPEWEPWVRLCAGVAVTTAGWMAVTWITPPTETGVLQRFYDKIRPLGRGWKRVVSTEGREPDMNLSAALLCVFLGCAAVYGALFGTGFWIFGNVWAAVPCHAMAAGAAWWIARLLPTIHAEKGR